MTWPNGVSSGSPNVSAGERYRWRSRYRPLRTPSALTRVSGPTGLSTVVCVRCTGGPSISMAGGCWRGHSVRGAAAHVLQHVSSIAAAAGAKLAENGHYDGAPRCCREPARRHAWGFELGDV